MKLISYRHDGRETYGIVSGDGIVDAGRRLGERLPTLRTALGAMDELSALAGEAPDVALSDIEYLQPITDPYRITCIGLNYKKHIEEVGAATPEFPSMFSRQPHCQVGHLGRMVRPKVSDNYDFEGEFAFVIGKPGRHIPKERALEHVAGYSILNDGSIRDFQMQHSVLAGKNFWHAGAFGPWLVTADEVPDPSALQLTTRLNGEVMQQAPTDDLLFTVSDLIAYLSQIWPMQVGDVVATGTPSGVGLGRSPNVWMQPGDTIEIEISGIGTLSNTVVAED
jgi:2-keto-4-pentenoate hydratase/2-oxohepta-3-ene-1,7-dioic acid hydratase in catechol pathway